MVSTRVRRTGVARAGISALLLVALVVLLGGYAALGTRLSLPVYYSEVPDGMTGALMRISQAEPALNLLSAEGLFEPGVLAWRASQVRATLRLDPHEEERRSAIPYQLEFHGEYRLSLPDTQLNTIEVVFPFPRNLQTLHDVQFLVNGDEPRNVEFGTQGIRWQDQFIGRGEHVITIRYRAEGAHTFSYVLPKEQRTDVDVAVTVVGLSGSSVPQSSLQPIEIEANGEGETLVWEYANLIDNRDILINLPSEPSFAERLGQTQVELRPMAASAPLIVAATLLALAGVFHFSCIRLRFEIYLIAGFGLALFFPLVTFLGALVGIPAAALIALLITAGLLIAFLSQTAGRRQAGWRTAVVVGISLGVVALGRLTEWSGLLLTVGSLAMLGIFMVVYARWARDRQESEAAVPVEPLEQAPAAVVPEQDTSPALEMAGSHCPQCGHALEGHPNYCPACGYEARGILRCEACGREQILPEGLSPAYCLGCGKALR